MANEKIRCGDINVTMAEEQTLWMDRRRVTVFALPWSFTKYELTPSRLFISSGFLNRREDEIRLYRIRDVSYTQSLLERLSGTGTLRVLSTDVSIPEIDLRHIKNARRVKDVLSQAIEVSRRENGVRTSELLGGVQSEGDDSASDGEALGPELTPDFNGNGIDDRLE